MLGWLHTYWMVECVALYMLKGTDIGNHVCLTKWSVVGREGYACLALDGYTSTTFDAVGTSGLLPV
eukprot:6177369-Pleurochrysis_carterae.AAC.6